MRLSHKDLQRILESVNILATDDEPETLPARTNDSVKYLISTDVLSFEAFGTDNDYKGLLWYTPANSISNDVLAVIAELAVEQPFYEDVINLRIRRSSRVSDYMSLSDYKKTELYNEFFRKIDTDRQLTAGLQVSPKLMVTCSLCRLKRDFTETDCNKFDLLAPHLEYAFRNAKYISRLKAESSLLQVALEAKKIAVIKLDAELRPENIDPIAQTQFQKYFEDNSGSLPGDVICFVRYTLAKIQSEEFFLPPDPLEISVRNGKLRISLSYNAIAETCLLFLEEVSHGFPPVDANLPLTDREKEVLHWVSFGKTDVEIGILLSISTRTVQKHLENIYQKLGVETRTSAMAIFLGK